MSYLYIIQVWRLNNILKTLNITFYCIVGTKNYTYRLPKDTPVPSVDTTYMCMSFDLPQDDDYHMVAFEPLLDNLDIMHHIVLIGCEGGE